MNNESYLWVRREVKPFEYRVPIIPDDINLLVSRGIKVTVEKCSNRCFSDEEYKAAGATISSKSFEYAPKNAYILGLKDLPIKRLLNHSHIFFSHALFGQSDKVSLIKKFKADKGVILDLELLTDESKKRVVTFSHDAGRVAGGLAIILWHKLITLQNINEELKDFTFFEIFSEKVKKRLNEINKKPTIIIVGSKGKVGLSALFYLRELGLEPIEFDSNSKKNLSDITHITRLYDIVINCISVSKPFKTFCIHKKMQHINTKLIIDATCEPKNNNNPVPIYSFCNRLNNPVTEIDINGNNLYISAIDNLATLISKESSNSFSKNLTPYLLDILEKGVLQSLWKTPYFIYESFK